MKYSVYMTKLFKRQLKKVIKQGVSEEEIAKIIADLKNGPVSPNYHNAHKLKGSFTGMMELHIAPNLLLIYEHYVDIGVLQLTNIGSHSELFG